MSDLGDELRAGVEAFLAQRYDDRTRLAILEGREAGSSILGAAAEEGWFNLAMPEAQGGMGIDPSDLVPSFQALGHRLAGGPFFEHMVIPALLTRELELTPAITARLARSIRGEAQLAFADTGASLDWTLGDVVERDGKLTGSVALVRFGAESDEILMAGRDCLALVDARATGVNLTKLSSTDPGIEFARLELAEVALQADEVLARGEGAINLARKLRAWARIAASAELTGIARRALDLALSYAAERKQFDRPIATFQAVRHLAASAAQRVIELECLAEMIVTDAADMSDVDLELAGMTYKAAAAELARGVVEDAIQMHGGIAFTYEYELQWYYKRSLALRAWYGDETELYRDIGRQRLLPGRPAVVA